MLLRQTLLYLPAQVIGPLAQVAAGLVWTYWLAPAPYGVLTLLFASQELIFLVCHAWWTQYTLRYAAAHGRADNTAFGRSEPAIALLCAGIQVAGTAIMLACLDQRPGPDLVISASIYVTTRSLLFHLGERARALGRIGAYTTGQIAGSVVGFATAYLAVVLVAPTPAAVLAGLAAAQALGIILMWRQLGLTARIVRPSRKVLAAAIAYGAPLLIAGGAAWLAQNSIRLEVQYEAGAEALGLVAVGWGLGVRLSATLSMLVIAASFPLAIRSLETGSRQSGFDQLGLAGVMLMALIAPASVGLGLLAHPFVTLFVAEPYRTATIAILPLAAATGALRNIRMHAVEPVFLLMERPRVTTLINVGDAVCVLVGCAIGLKLGGLVAATAGCLIGTIVSGAATLVGARRTAGYRFPFGAAIRIAVASGIMAFAIKAFDVLGTGRSAPMVLVVDTAFGATVYALAMAALFPAAITAMWRRLRRDQRVGIGVPLR